MKRDKIIKIKKEDWEIVKTGLISFELAHFQTNEFQQEVKKIRLRYD